MRSFVTCGTIGQRWNRLAATIAMANPLCPQDQRTRSFQHTPPSLPIPIPPVAFQFEVMTGGCR